ncbi:MAG: hypothetical protein CK522_03265 [Opitutia bacterium]|nr:MAG: hypothetical protein CK522_03265 [Opitutae bacterium]
MESYAVVLADLDSLSTERDRRKAYVGISRAKYALYILASLGCRAGLALSLRTSGTRPSRRPPTRWPLS